MKKKIIAVVVIAGFLAIPLSFLVFLSVSIGWWLGPLIVLLFVGILGSQHASNKSDREEYLASHAAMSDTDFVESLGAPAELRGLCLDIRTAMGKSCKLLPETLLPGERFDSIFRFCGFVERDFLDFIFSMERVLDVKIPRGSFEEVCIYGTDPEKLSPAERRAAEEAWNRDLQVMSFGEFCKRFAAGLQKMGIAK